MKRILKGGFFFFSLFFLALTSPWAQQTQVALLPPSLHGEVDPGLRKALWNLLSTRLMARGDLVVVDRSVLERFSEGLGEEEIDERTARWLGRRIGTQFVIFGSLTKVGGYLSLDLKILDVTKAGPPKAVYGEYSSAEELLAGLDTLAGEVRDKILGRETVRFRSGGTLKASLLYQAVGYTKLQRFPGKILKGVAVGDVDGEGHKEIVLMEPHALWIYRDTGRELKLIAEHHLSVAHNLLTVGTVDVDGDGREEIAVTDAIGDDLQSFILAFKGGQLKYKAKGINRYLCVKEIGGRKLLLGQAMGKDSDYDGPIEELHWSKGKLRSKGPLKGLPAEVGWLYCFVLGYFTGGQRPEVAYVNSMGELRLLTLEGEQLWRGGTHYCMSDNFFDRPEVYADAKGMPSPFPRRVYIPTKMLSRDLDADGFDELVLPVNRFIMGEHVERVRVYDKGHLLSLVWDGMAMAEAWRTQNMPGCIFDFEVADSDNDGRAELIAVVVSAHFLKKKASSNLVVFELYE